MKLFSATILPIITLFFCISSPILATDYKPWYGRVLELDLGADCLMQAFDRVDTHHSCGKRPEFDTFIDLSASLAVWDGIAAELEVIAAQTRHQSFGMDAIRLTGRYRWLNDIIGDPISLSTGITFSGIFPPMRHNIASFDHGGIAGEAHVSVGKEWICMQYWTSRAWGVFGVGIADVGSAWLRGNLGWEYNWWNRHRLEFLVESIWGLGENNLNLDHFRGYGSVQYQAIDLGVRYHFQLDHGIVLTAGYGYRAYSRNCPQNVNFILLKLLYPF